MYVSAYIFNGNLSTLTKFITYFTITIVYENVKY